MPDAAMIPTWVGVVVAVGTPVLTFCGVLLANWLSRQTAHETETRSRREETMRNLRWAAELAVSDDPRSALLGLTQLQALDEAEMLDAEQKVFVTAALGAVVAEPLSTIAAAEEAGQEVVVEVSDPATPADPGVAWGQDDGEEL
ncbi:hypothetical protein [Terrabacter sp. NPDC000476]|uniref:hypothetical protein n=1 Tax=Terrabacter sp. NPDC000476 TaxID=3154258 RepID=UPI003329EFA0